MDGRIEKMGKLVRYGMVGGGPGAFIGDAHRRAIACEFTKKINFSPSDVAFDEAIKAK